MRRRRVARPRPQRHPTKASDALAEARRRAGLLLQRVAAAIGVHPRTLKRWELGETKPTPQKWRELVAFFDPFAPAAASKLALAAGVPWPPTTVVTVDLAAIERALSQAADQLDVSPRRLRAAVRNLANAVAAAQGSLRDLAAAAQEKETVSER